MTHNEPEQWTEKTILLTLQIWTDDGYDFMVLPCDLHDILINCLRMMFSHIFFTLSMIFISLWLCIAGERCMTDVNHTGKYTHLHRIHGEQHVIVLFP